MSIKSEAEDRSEITFPQPEHPLNRPIIEKMHELAKAAAFREVWQEHPGFEITFPLSSKDLKTSEAISKTIPEALNYPWLKVSLTAGYRLLPPDTYPRNPQIIEKMGALTLKVIPSIHPEDKPGGIGLAIDASYAVSGHKDDMTIYANVVFGRIVRLSDNPQVEGTVRIQDPEMAERIVDDLIAIAKRLRGEYTHQEEERKERYLTQAEIALSGAIKGKGQEIRRFSNCRGFFDEFLLIGHINEETGVLGELKIGFSSGNDRRQNTKWRDERVLDSLSFSSPDGSISLKTRSKLKRVEKDDSDCYKAEGSVEIATRGGKVLQQIPVGMIEVSRETFFFNDVSEMLANGFSHFIEHKALAPDKDCRAPILLGTSIEV